MKRSIGAGISGFGAGMLNGLFGAGGGMVLVPLMGKLTDLEDRDLFPSSIVILFPICIISLLFADGWDDFQILQAIPYLLGSALGGVGAGLWGKYIPAIWLHRALGLLILWGGIRYLCQPS